MQEQEQEQEAGGRTTTTESVFTGTTLLKKDRIRTLVGCRKPPPSAPGEDTTSQQLVRPSRLRLESFPGSCLTPNPPCPPAAFCARLCRSDSQSPSLCQRLRVAVTLSQTSTNRLHRRSCLSTARALCNRDLLFAPRNFARQQSQFLDTNQLHGSKMRPWVFGRRSSLQGCRCTFFHAPEASAAALCTSNA